MLTNLVHRERLCDSKLYNIHGSLPGLVKALFRHNIAYTHSIPLSYHPSFKIKIVTATLTLKNDLLCIPWSDIDIYEADHSLQRFSSTIINFMLIRIPESVDWLLILE